ncbi:MAG: PfkB family carbohydrate kinase, partial [Nocardioidaceae bacterium]
TADLDEAAVADARVVHLTGITPALSTSAREAVWACVDIARAAGTAVSLDFNYRSALWAPEVASRTLRDLAARADIVFATSDEARLVCDGVTPRELARELGRLGPREVLIKLGARGSVSVVDGAPYETPAEAVREIDPVGAGDAFCAGYLAEWCRGSDARSRLAAGSFAGAYAVTVDGDWEGLPSRADLDRRRRRGDVIR